MKLAVCLLLLVAFVVHNYAYPGGEPEKAKEKLPVPKGNPLDEAKGLKGKDKELEKLAGGKEECEGESKPKHNKKKNHHKKKDDEDCEKHPNKKHDKPKDDIIGDFIDTLENEEKEVEDTGKKCIKSLFGFL